MTKQDPEHLAQRPRDRAGSAGRTDGEPGPGTASNRARLARAKAASPGASNAFARERIPELEAAVNETIARGLRVGASAVTNEEFRRRPELVRTLEVLPPVVDGKVRVVEIEGFDAQACGGTHVHGTAEIGRARVAKFDDKGKDNKRFYWELEALPPPA